MNNYLKWYFVLLLLSCAILPIASQSVVIKAEIDSTHLFIGEQTKIHLEIAAGKNQAVQIPVLTDTIMRGVEILEMSKIDTIDIGNDRVQLKYDYLVTSFDSAVYLLPPFRAISGIDTAYSKELALKVSTIPVDVDSPDQYFDIKDVIRPKFVLKDYLPILLWVLLIILVIALLAYLIYRKSNSKTLVPFRKEEPYLPPHIRAAKELDELKARKLWQQGKTKEYHSGITDILRIYIDERFNVSAMEMTSGEILDALKGISEVDIAYDNLKQVLQLADFVKFAKYNSLPDENELSIMNAYIFVNNTQKKELVLEVKPETEDEKDSDIKTEEITKD